MNNFPFFCLIISIFNAIFFKQKSDLLINTGHKIPFLKRYLLGFYQPNLMWSIDIKTTKFTPILLDIFIVLQTTQKRRQACILAS